MAYIKLTASLKQVKQLTLLIKMTPAVKHIKKTKFAFTIHEYTHETHCESYGTEAANKLGIIEERVFKTLIINTADQQLAVAIIPVSKKLNMKLAAKALNSKKAVMAEASLVERSTGYVLGGVSPLGQKKRLTTIIDESAQQYSTIFVSAGKRGLELELAADDLKQLCNGKFLPLSQKPIK